jgi:hypothetical protein
VSSSRETSLISAEEREQYLETREKRFLIKWNAVMSATTLTGEAGFKKAWTALRLQYLAEGPEILPTLRRPGYHTRRAFVKHGLTLSDTLVTLQVTGQKARIVVSKRSFHSIVFISGRLSIL